MKLGLVALLLAECCLARGPITLMELWERSSFVVVATLESMTALPSDVKYPSAPYVPVNTEGVVWQACKARLRVDYVVQGGGAPRVFDVLIYSFRSDCQLSFRPKEEPLPRQALWFLRQEGGWYRPAMDFGVGFRRLHSFPSHLSRRLDALPDAAMRIGYVLLAPGIAFPPERGFRGDMSANPSIRVEHYIRLLREIYLDYGPSTREQIARDATDLGLCLNRMKATHIMGEPIEEYDQWMTRRVTAYDARLSKQLPARERAGLRDDLEWFACTSTKTLRAKSRELLERHFYIRPERIVCIPCE